MIPNLIMKQIRQGERNITEFKKSIKNFDVIAKSVCAFLNTEGGTVFCGIDDENHIIGVDASSKIIDDMFSFLMNSITPKAIFSIDIDDSDGKQIVTIEVPKGVDQPYIFKGAVYVRHGKQVRTADSEKLRQIVQQKAVKPERWERHPSITVQKNDFDKEEITEVINKAEKSGRFYFENKELSSVLEKLSMCVNGQFTNAADILFAMTPERRHPQIRVRATCFLEDKDSSEFSDDQIFQGPLAQILDKVQQFIQKHIITSVKFQNDSITTIDKPMYPPEAIREGLVNAFAHRDYADFSGGIAVGIYPSRIEIWNSGHLPEGIKPGDLKKNHPSLPVNPDIVHVLYLCSLMNRIGRGTQNIVNSCCSHGLPSPRWKDNSFGVTLTLYNNLGRNTPLQRLNKRQQALLDSMNVGDTITTKKYNQTFAEGVTPRQARRDLTELVNANILEGIGARKTLSYRRTARKL